MFALTLGSHQQFVLLWYIVATCLNAICAIFCTMQETLKPSTNPEDG